MLDATLILCLLFFQYVTSPNPNPNPDLSSQLTSAKLTILPASRASVWTFNILTVIGYCKVTSNKQRTGNCSHVRVGV